ncbi:MAG TPA: lytic transglycosylase domain-containing protein [bacterium]|nr:lytic transglycosylase domain-containing protein [bacterium]HPM47991.1 lytic transglycosylase domain-containing protein [bacterium]HQO92368.1 lytic transglycosylase domain-containing protein [bacterium]
MKIKVYICIFIILIIFPLFLFPVEPCSLTAVIERSVKTYPYYVNNKKYFIHPALILGIIEQESSFDPEAKSHAGAYGLTQIMPKTAKILKCDYDKLNNPELAINCSVKFLAALLTYNKGDLIKSLSGYNGGTHSTETKATTADGLLAGRIYDHPETKKYVVSVLKRFENFKNLNCKKQ